MDSLGTAFVYKTSNTLKLQSLCAKCRSVDPTATLTQNLKKTKTNVVLKLQKQINMQSKTNKRRKCSEAGVENHVFTPIIIYFNYIVQTCSDFSNVDFL